MSYDQTLTRVETYFDKNRDQNLGEADIGCPGVKNT